MAANLFLHSDLCQLAKSWLLRPNSRGGHGCQVALTECRSGWGCEMPDAIGFRAAGLLPESVVVEVKVSRADFLADFKKPHRADGAGLGQFRYYLCPEGIITPDDLPERWGLLTVNERGQVKAVQGPVAVSNNSGTFPAACEPWRHIRDIERELWLLVRVMARIDDPDKIKATLNTAQREQARLAQVCESQSQELRRLRQAMADARRAAFDE